MNTFWSKTIASPRPGVRRDSKIGRALSGKSSQASGRMIVSKKATPSARPGWRAAQSKASAPPQS